MEQTNKYMEQLGAKVTLEKIEQQNKKKKMVGHTNSDGEEMSAPKQTEEVQEDAFEDMLNDSERIKMNIKNSNKVYYSVTHTI